MTDVPVRKLDWWRCEACERLSVQLPGGERGFEGHAPGICAGCSTRFTDEAIAAQSVPPYVGWVVADLRRQLRQEQQDRAADLRDMAREMRDQ